MSSGRGNQRWRRLWSAMVPSPRRFVALCVAATVAGILEAALLVAVVQIAVTIAAEDEALGVEVLGLDLEASTSTVTAVAFVAAGAKLAAGWITASLSARLATDAVIGMRARLFSALVGSSWERQANEPVGRIQEMLGGHVNQLSATVTWLSAGAVSGANLVVLTAVAMAVQPLTALVILVAVVILALIARPLTRMARRATTDNAVANVAYASRSVELVSVGLEVTAFDVADEVETAMERLVLDAARPFQQSRRLTRLLPELYTTSALVLLFCGLLVADAATATNLGALGAVIVLLVRALTRAQGAQSSYHRVSELAPYVHDTLDHVEDLGRCPCSWAAAGRAGSGREVQPGRCPSTAASAVRQPPTPSRRDDRGCPFRTSTRTTWSVRRKRISAVPPTRGVESTIPPGHSISRAASLGR